MTGTVPSPPGEVTLIICSPGLVLLGTTETFVPGVEPKDTVDLALNPAPVMVTGVPPVAGPEVGETEIITGL